MKLHWSPRSPFVRKVMIVAHELGLVERIECVRTVVATTAPHAGLMADNPLSNAFWNYAGEQWSEVENASNRLFAGVNSPQAAGAGAGRDRLVLSGPVRLSQRVVMQVQADEPEVEHLEVAQAAVNQPRRP